MTRRTLGANTVAVVALIAVWLLFFWRLFTPIAEDQASLKQGDFSGQFVAFAAYQYERFADGEIPLWNPYNNGGLPFIADTQAAVFYPPRLITIALARVAGGFTYHALELEMTAHVLAYTLMMYAFMRYVLRRERAAELGAFTAAVVAGYGGFLSGYPPLQLALLEAGIWLPLAALGLHAASDGEKFRPAWLALTGFAYGLSWLAGHPQTSYLLTFFLVAYWAYRVYTRRWSWLIFVGGAAAFGLIGGGLAAVQLLPGVEYLSLTTRAGFGYDDKSNGFPIQDIAQFVFPRVVSLFSPLYVGFMALILAIIGVSRRKLWFWGGLAILALLWSFGGNAALYPLLYNILPGLRYFRGQERGAYLVANSLAVLAGFGIAYLAARNPLTEYAFALRIRNGLNRVFWAVLTFTALIFALWIGNSAAYGEIVGEIAFGAVMIGIAYFLLPTLMAKEQRPIVFLAIPIVILLELFTVNMNAPSNYDSTPPNQQISMTPPPLISQVLADTDAPFRVDGQRGVLANYGSLYGVQDIHGISPLWLSGAYTLIEGDIPDPVSWELFAVRYVFTDWQELPIPSEIVGTGTDAYGAINLHRLDNPRPFALIMNNAVLAENDNHAYAMLRDPNFDVRGTLILNEPVTIQLVSADPIPAETVDFAPESFTVRGLTPSGALLSVALPYHPGWRAELDGQPLPILRAYGGLSATTVPSGDWTIQFIFDPLSYRVGAIMSIATWIALIAFGGLICLRLIRTRSRRG